MKNQTIHTCLSLAAAAGLLAASILSACAAPATATPTAQPSPTALCDQPETVGEDAGMAEAVRNILRSKYLDPTRTVVTIHSVACPGQPQPTITRIDLDLDVRITDITATILIAQPVYWAIDALDQVSYPVPGEIHITFESTGQTDSLNFTRDEGRRAIAAGDIGIPLLSTLGYPLVLPETEPCTAIWSKEPLPDLTQQVRKAFDREGLTDLNVSVAMIGRRCGDDFTPVQSEFQVMMVGTGNKSIEREIIGNKTAKVFSALLSIPTEQIPGDTSPRVLMVEGWNLRRVMLITLDRARELQSQDLTGITMFRAAWQQ